jgi:non-haem Fe2+, alpha-ketoglutarate-dependent halogenase
MSILAGMIIATPKMTMQFVRDGIRFPIPVLSRAEVQLYRSKLDETRQSLGRKGERLPSCELYFPWAYDLTFHPLVLDAVAEVLGPDVFNWGSLVLSKPPHSRTWVSWHQDGAYASFLNGAAAVSAWIALSDSTVEGGCMRVVRETHRQPLKHSERVTRDNLLKNGQVVNVEVDESRVVDVVLKAGEMSLHDVNIIHGSNPNGSTHDRTGFIARFAGPGTKVGTQALRAKGDRAYERLEIPRPAEPVSEAILQRYRDFLDSPEQTRRLRVD